MALRGPTYGAENSTVEHDQSQDGYEDQRHRVCNQNVIPGIFQVVSDLRGNDYWQIDFLGFIFSQSLVKERLIAGSHLRAKFKEARNVKDDAENSKQALTSKPNFDDSDANPDAKVLQGLSFSDDFFKLFRRQAPWTFQFLTNFAPYLNPTIGKVYKICRVQSPRIGAPR